MVSNSGDFDQKLTRTLATVLNILGEPEPVEVERKWLLAAPPSAAFLAKATPVEIEQVYLYSTDGERRVRSRTHEGHTTYFHTHKRATDSAASRIEDETIISRESYGLMEKMQSLGTARIIKKRYCFAANGQHFELDQFIAPITAWVLEAELVAEGDEVTLPEGLRVDREVTDDPQWRNNQIARLHAFAKPH